MRLTLGHNTFAYLECSVGYLHEYLLEVGPGSQRPSERRVLRNLEIMRTRIFVTSCLEARFVINGTGLDWRR